MGSISYLPIGFVVYYKDIASVVRATFTTLPFLLRSIDYDE